MVRYDCMKCPGYCCSYPVIEVTKADIARLAAHFEISEDEARTRYTKKGHGHDCILRRKQDEHFGRICRLFDTEARRCTVYAARPSACRKFPGEARCGYYDFLVFERRHQSDPEFIATTDSSPWK